MKKLVLVVATLSTVVLGCNSREADSLTSNHPRSRPHPGMESAPPTPLPPELVDASDEVGTVESALSPPLEIPNAWFDDSLVSCGAAPNWTTNSYCVWGWDIFMGYGLGEGGSGGVATGYQQCGITSARVPMPLGTGKYSLQVRYRTEYTGDSPEEPFPGGLATTVRWFDAAGNVIFMDGRTAPSTWGSWEYGELVVLKPYYARFFELTLTNTPQYYGTVYIDHVYVEAR